MAEEKKKANQELRTIEYVDKHGRFIDIINRPSRDEELTERR